MRQPRIGITGVGSVSALGQKKEDIWNRYLTPDTLISQKSNGDFSAAIPRSVEDALKLLAAEHKYFSKIDRSVQLGMLAAREAVKQAGWNSTADFGINMASSRGATASFEQYFDAFKKHPKKSAQALSSPMTTLGNLATWVAKDLNSNGPSISHSITCSSAAHALLNGVAWLRAGLADKFLIGGTEAPLTNFTIAQMKALKIYQNAKEPMEYPCHSLDLKKENNSMVLGEGAACFCLEKEPEKPLAWISGMGFFTEDFQHPAQVSKEGKSFEIAMQQALNGMDKNSIDAIILHAPGTMQGDKAEYSAIQSIFDEKMPKLTTNKWKIGHTLGASAALSMEFALLLLENDVFIGIPFLEEDFMQKKTMQKIMVNSLGFGGNAVSIILEKAT